MMITLIVRVPDGADALVQRTPATRFGDPEANGNGNVSTIGAGPASAVAAPAPKGDVQTTSVIRAEDFGN
jgi:hypothetical protein